MEAMLQAMPQRAYSIRHSQSSANMDSGDWTIAVDWPNENVKSGRRTISSRVVP